jgi:hypothetical protein
MMRTFATFCCLALLSVSEASAESPAPWQREFWSCVGGYAEDHRADDTAQISKRESRTIADSILGYCVDKMPAAMSQKERASYLKSARSNLASRIHYQINQVHNAKN